MPKPSPDTIMEPFIELPQEAAIIGRILAGYGEIEFLIYHCMASVMGSADTAARAFFRFRSEKNREDIADAILYEASIAAEIEQGYLEAMAAVKYCRKTRNQYAHCHWYDNTAKGLFFANLETAAQTKKGTVIMKFNHVDVPLLEQQEAYFALLPADADMAPNGNRPLGGSNRHPADVKAAWKTSAASA